MKIVKLFARLLSYCFVFIFCVLCLTLTLLIMVKNMTSYDSINKCVENANIFDYSSEQVINSDDNTLRQNIEKDLLNVDIPILVTDSVLDSDQINKLVSDYIYDYSQYLLLGNSKPIFHKEKIISLFEDEYFRRQNVSLSDNQKIKIEKYIDFLGRKVEKNVFDKGELDEVVSLNVLQQVATVINSDYIVIVFVLLIALIFAVLCICLQSFKKSFCWCYRAIVFDGVLLIVSSFVEVKLLIMYFNSQGLIDNLAILIVENGFKNMLIYGSVLIAVGLLLMMISIVLLKQDKKRQSKELLEKTIVSEIENEEYNNRDSKAETKKDKESLKVNNSSNKNDKPLENKDNDKQDIVEPVSNEDKKEIDIKEEIPFTNKPDVKDNTEETDSEFEDTKQIKLPDKHEVENDIDNKPEEESNEDDKTEDIKEDVKKTDNNSDDIEENVVSKISEDEGNLKNNNIGIADKVLENSNNTNTNKTNNNTTNNNHKKKKKKKKNSSGVNNINNGLMPVKEEKIEIVPVPVEQLPLATNEPIVKDKEDYVELNDTIEKKNIDIKPLDHLKIDVVHPEKGKDVYFDPNKSDDDDDDIEIL